MNFKRRELPGLASPSQRAVRVLSQLLKYWNEAALVQPARLPFASTARRDDVAEVTAIADGANFEL